MSTNKTIFPLEPEVIEVYLDEVKTPSSMEQSGNGFSKLYARSAGCD